MPEDRTEILRGAEKQLSRVVYELTWAGCFWGLKGAINYARQRAEYLTQLGEKVAALSSLSSTYYAAAGHAEAQAGLSLWLRPFWLFRDWYSSSRAERLSDRLFVIVGRDIRAMNPDELNIRASILHRAGRYHEALVCLEAALGRQGKLKADTRALLEVKMAEVLDRLGQGSKAEHLYQLAFGLKVEPTTSVRLYKSLGQHCLAFSEWERASSALATALKIAEENNLGDQIVKIKVLERKLLKLSG